MMLSSLCAKHRHFGYLEGLGTECMLKLRGSFSKKSWQGGHTTAGTAPYARLDGFACAKLFAKSKSISPDPVALI